MLAAPRSFPQTCKITMAEAKKTSTLWQTVKPFVNGGSAGMAATCVIQPIDMVKVCYADGILPSPPSCPLPGTYLESLCISPLCISPLCAHSLPDPGSEWLRLGLSPLGSNLRAIWWLPAKVGRLDR